MQVKSTTGMLLSGVFSSEAIDTSGEIVKLSGMDISTMEEGNATANFEHLGDDSGGFGREIVGHIIYVKKVFKESDCEDDNQRMYWEKLKGIPFLYGIVRLYDGAGHEGAKALAAMIRDHVANDEPISCKFSIEGTTTSKIGNVIEESLAKKVAITIKPANKTCISSMLSDPNAPEGFPKVVEKTELRFVDPEFRPLGGAHELECNPWINQEIENDETIRILSAAGAIHAVRKALTAGSTDAAPSTLTGGAALQREDISKKVHNQALAALRDYGSKKFQRSEFKGFVKAKLPEVSDDFLDHFTDIAEAYSLRKAAMLLKALPSGIKKVKADKPLVEDISDAEEALPETSILDKGKIRNLEHGTSRGKSLQPNAGMVRPEFDSEKGMLHTPIGSFKAYLPQHDGPASAANYQQILSHPDIENAMDHATGNWAKVHKLLKAGKLPPEVIMHGVLFAQLSPNKPVPTQELQFARLVDAMRNSGIDPRKPGFEKILPHIHALDKPDVYPETAREEIKSNPAYHMGDKIGVERNLLGEKIGKPSPVTGRYPGEILSANPLLNDNVKNMARYYELHDALVDLAGRHRHDMMGAVSELMDQKRQGINQDNIRRAAIKAGKPDPGESKGLEIPGLKVKTGLYTWGMLGGGNSVVPDTHFIRNAFGLDMRKDKDTLKYLKNLFWRPTNMHLMQGLNDWYSKNHPAVEYTVNHPKWGSTFDKREDALFPSFWRHWLTIKPHEEFLGMPNLSEQARTTHAPFWSAIAPHVDPLVKNGNLDPTIPLRTALVHQQYIKDYGEVPAQLMYYRFLVPQLLAAAEHRERFGRDMQFLAKTVTLETGILELRKSIRQVLDGKPEHPEVHSINFQIGNKSHPAGRYMVHNGQLTHLEDYHGLLSSMVPEGPVDATTVSRLNGLEFAPHIVLAPHEAPVTSVSREHTATAKISVQPSLPPPRPPVFEYHRVGMVRPSVVEFGPAGIAIDGRGLDEVELKLMMDNIRKGVATLRYRSGATNESSNLSKAEGEMDPGDALQHVRAAVAAGQIHPDVERALTRHIYEDRMIPGVGNQYAYKQFRAKGRPGVYVSLDGNDLKHLNDSRGHDAGDAAITAGGAALRAAADKVGTGKLFRSGGDEFVAHFPTFEEASRFGRYAREHLDQIPPIAGAHKLTFSMGFGSDFPSADKALYAAKDQKIDPITGRRAFPPGRTPHLAHSLIPGSEGPISLHSEVPPTIQAPVVTEPKSAIAAKL